MQSPIEFWSVLVSFGFLVQAHLKNEFRSLVTGPPRGPVISQRPVHQPNTQSPASDSCSACQTLRPEAVGSRLPDGNQYCEIARRDQKLRAKIGIHMGNNRELQGPIAVFEQNRDPKEVRGG